MPQASAYLSKIEAKSDVDIPKKGLNLESIFDLYRLKVYTAEVFWIEVQKLMRHQGIDIEEEGFSYVVCNGNSGWRYKRDVIDLISQSHLVGEKYEYFNVIKLSRNGIYQSLPEAMFHPISLGNAYASIDEIVTEIRNNTLVSQECKQLFSLFDSILFEYKAEFLSKQMSWPYLQYEHLIIQLGQEFFGHDLDHTYAQAITLLGTIAFHQDIKCSYDLQAQLLGMLIGKRVEIREIPYYFKHPVESEFTTLGGNTLGINAGLMGAHRAELDDLLVEIWLGNASAVDIHMRDQVFHEYIKGILDCFDITSREVHIKFQIEDDSEKRILGTDAYLGINVGL